MDKRKQELKNAFQERLKAKNQFVEIANSKHRTKKELLETYERYTKADDTLINVFKRIKYDKVA